jgi:hypothetical protein
MKLWFHNTTEMWTVIAVAAIAFGIAHLIIWIASMI